MGSRNQPPPIPGSQPAPGAPEQPDITAAVTAAVTAAMGPMMQAMTQQFGRMFQQIQRPAPMAPPPRPAPADPLLDYVSKMNPEEEPLAPLFQQMARRTVASESTLQKALSALQRIEAAQERRETEGRLASLASQKVPEEIADLRDIAQVVALASRKAGIEMDEGDVMDQFSAKIAQVVAARAEKLADDKLRASLRPGAPSIDGIGLAGLRAPAESEEAEDARWGDITALVSAALEADPNANADALFAELDGEGPQH